MADPPGGAGPQEQLLQMCFGAGERELNLAAVRRAGACFAARSVSAPAALRSTAAPLRSSAVRAATQRCTLMHMLTTPFQILRC